MCIPSEAQQTARRTFSELPLVLIATSASPGCAKACTCRSKTPANPKSFAEAVRMEVSVVRAIAANPGRGKSWLRTLTNSPAMC